MITVAMLVLAAQAGSGESRGDCGRMFLRGIEQYHAKEFNQALITFRESIQCDPKLVQPHLAMADVYAGRGNDAEAIRALLEALRIEPRNELALRAAATLYLKNGVHLKAQPLLETLTEVAPKSAEAHADLAAVYAAAGDRERAERSFRRALQLDPGAFPALAGLGNLLARAGDDTAAVPLLRKAVAAMPGAYEGHFLLGSALNRMSQFEEAGAELRKASELERGKDDAQVFYQLARALGGLGKADERRAALARFSELTKQEKENTQRQRQAAAWIDEARELVQKGTLLEATKKLELAREATPGDATLLFRLAGLHYDLEKFEAAREYAQAAISISPSTWLYHYLLGLVERAMGHGIEARASLETAAKLEPAEAPVWNSLGQVLMDAKDAAGAVVAFEKAVQLAPADPDFRTNLESARARVKR